MSANLLSNLPHSLVPIAVKWGLPDWRDPTAYGDWEDSEVKWRWEFTRRCPAVREAFEKLSGPTRESMLATPEYRDRDPEPGEQPNDPGFWAMSPDGFMFGMEGIPNPAISDQPMLENLFFGLRQRAKIGEGSDPTDPDAWTMIGLLQSEVAIVFDLTKPPRSQFEAALKTFRRAQRHVGLGQKVRPRNKDKWIQHLRVLDARECGASWATIAKEALNLKAFHSSPAQQARGAWKDACALRDDWPTPSSIPAEFRKS